MQIEAVCFGRYLKLLKLKVFNSLSYQQTVLITIFRQLSTIAKHCGAIGFRASLVSPKKANARLANSNSNSIWIKLMTEGTSLCQLVTSSSPPIEKTYNRVLLHFF